MNWSLGVDILKVTVYENLYSSYRLIYIYIKYPYRHEYLTFHMTLKENVKSVFLQIFHLTNLNV